jgi:hypothetical protein
MSTVLRCEHQLLIQTRGHHKRYEVCDLGVYLNDEIPNSSYYFTASKNGTTRQTDQSWYLQRFYPPFSKTGFPG